MNISQFKHQKVFTIGIKGTTDKGSGVKSIQVFGQAVNERTDPANINDASLLGIIEDVDNTPSGSLTGTNPSLIVLRDANSNSIAGTSNKPKHSPNNVYPFHFENYVNGKYYHIWMLAVDKAGNLEVLPKTDTPSVTSTAPDFTTTEKLVDDIAPEFEDIEQLEDLVWNTDHYEMNVPSSWTVGSDSDARNYLKDRVIIFHNNSADRTRYVADATYDAVNDKIVLSINTSNLSGNASTGSTKLLPLVKANGGVGYLELEYGLSQDVNLKGYKIERAVQNSNTLPLANRNITYEGDFPSITWEVVGYINAEKVTDRGLVLSKANLESSANSESAKKFLYRITPVSIWVDANGNEILGQSIYTTKKNFNTINYRPSKGELPQSPENLLVTSNNDGSITIEWSDATDSNGDLRGYELQRQRKVGSIEEPFITISSLEKDLYDAGDTYARSFIDFNLEPNQPDNITYKYRVRTNDWAGNVSAWETATDFISATDTQIPNKDSADIAVTGKIGGWKGKISFLAEDKVRYVDIWAKTAELSTNVDSSTEKYIGRFEVGLIEGTGSQTLEFSYFDAPDNVKNYAKFDFELVDRWNNKSGRKGFLPESPVFSLTPQSVIDAFAPSTKGFTVTPLEIPQDIEISVGSKTNNSTFVISGALGLKADELIGKTIINNETGEQRQISTNGATSGSSTSVTVSSAFTELTVGDALGISPTHVRITIDKQNAVSGTATSGSKTEITDTTKTWIVNQWTGWEVTIAGVVRQIASNTQNTITLKEETDIADPTGESYAIDFPSDISGYLIFRSKITAGTIENWVLVTDTKDWYSGEDTFDVVDRTISDVGTYRYGISAYDLNGNESDIKPNDQVNDVTITDIVAPGVPKVQGVVGGAGNLFIYWNRTADDIDHYVLNIKNGSNADVLANQEVLSESFTLFNVVATKTEIQAYKFKIIAYDKAGNSISSHDFEVPTGKFFLNDYVPASGTAPANPSSFTAVSNNDGKVTLTIAKANLNKETKYISVQRRDFNYNAGTWGAYADLVLLQVPSLDSSNNFIDDLKYVDNVNERIKVQYQIKAIGFNGLANASWLVGSEVSVVDFEGYDLADIEAEISVDIGKVWLKFKDVLDLNNAKYEIWRTPDTTTAWDNANFYTAVNQQPKPVNQLWERIATLQSTQDNNAQTDYIQYTDNDWQPNGTIDAEDTIITSMSYDRKALYAVVVVDQWGNRGTVFILPNGTKDTSSLITIPYEPRVNRIEKDAVYFDFNKGVQANRGDVPVNYPEAVLYKGKGIQITGDLKYDLDKFNGNYSVILRRLEKQLTDLSLSSVVDLFLYDTSIENANYSQINFPQLALFVATATQVKVYEYSTITLFDTYTPTVASGAINKIFFFEGKLYVGTTSATYTQNYIKDYINNNISQIHNYTVNVNDIYVANYLSKTYEVICTNSEVTIYNGTNTIRSFSKGVFEKAIIRKGYLYVYKDGVIYRSNTTLNLLDFSTDNTDKNIFEIFMSLENNFENMNEDSDMLLITENKLLTIIDDLDRKLKIGNGLNTLVPFVGSGLLCGVFEQLIDLLLITEDNKILLTEDNKEIII